MVIKTKTVFRLLPALSVFFLMLGLAGCHPHKKEIPTGSPIQLTNIYSSPAYDYSHLVNVLVLPVANPVADAYVKQKKSDLLLSLLRNFGKFNYFALQTDPDLTIKTLDFADIETGQIDRFRLGAIGAARNAQAVLVVSVGEYRPFSPMRMSVKAALTDARTGEKIWACDQIFDASDANVVNGMRYWWNTQQSGGLSSNRFELNQFHPTFFTDFVFFSIAQSYATSRVHNVEAIRNQAGMEQEKKKSIQEVQQHALR